MREVRKFYLLLHPRPAYIIGSGLVGERVNFMAASWVTPVAEEPPLVGVAIDVTSYTHELIIKYGEFTVNVLPLSRINDIYYFGSRSGRNEDKSSRLGYRKGSKVSAPVLLDAVGILECKVSHSIKANDVTFFIGEVVEAEADEEVFDERIGWKTLKAKIPLHNWGKLFYDIGRAHRVE
ncbi:MAG: flavin reductase family protein [Infirmifilum sp.]|jgi:flavin reductase (DIM6/NTAB) family NADH-FMN oxidoreductase RutF|uniref:flavin reductase family protein n=1 Tax=Infirmifilum TaxID=2856573 RepID=UPI002357EDB0